jgi:hypothetical protein
VSAAGSFTNAGSITLTNGDAAGNNATLNLAGKTLTNTGTINSESPHGGARTIEGTVTNSGNVSLGAGETLKLTGSYTQSKKGTLTAVIAGSSSFGALSASGTATLGGTLVIVQGFTASKGEKFAILTSSALSGKFKKVKNTKIPKTKPKLKYKPVYSATGLTLEVG